MMDSVVRIPFTKQGVGADAALSTIPVAGDIAGFVLTSYAIYKARQIGVSNEKLKPVLKMAVMDAVVGFIPVAGTIFDIFIRLAVRHWILCISISGTNTRSVPIIMWCIHFCMKVWNADNSNPLSGVILWWPGSGFICQIF